ncbi:MAG: HlyD family efflux transporter periplasmic adaptor subunit [bacterium]|nr:HlyD family efflux transporter periplasmic adaptor subunit [bacterium]
MIRKSLTAIFALLILLSLTGCGSSANKDDAIMKVKKETFQIVIPAFGELQAVQSTPITVPPQLQGRQTLAWMAYENSFVKKGETVIRLDDTWYRERMIKEQFNVSKLDLQINEMEGQMEKERNQLQSQLTLTAVEKELATLYGARDESVYSRNRIIEDAINLKYLKKKSLHYEQKKDKLEQKATAELQLLQLRKKTHMVKIKQYKDALQSLEIKAPHDGLFIYQRNWRNEKPQLGRNVWNGTKLGKLPDLKSMEAKVYVLESEAGGLKKDLQVSIELASSSGALYPGKVINIAAIAKALDKDSPLKYFEVKVSIEKTLRALMKPGSQVSTTIFVKKMENVISVPNQALFFEKEYAFVNIKNSSSVEKRRVETGIRSLTRTVIKKGLEEGETVFLGKPKDGEEQQEMPTGSAPESKGEAAKS